MSFTNRNEDVMVTEGIEEVDLHQLYDAEEAVTAFEIAIDLDVQQQLYPIAQEIVWPPNYDEDVIVDLEIPVATITPDGRQAETIKLNKLKRTRSTVKLAYDRFKSIKQRREGKEYVSQTSVDKKPARKISATCKSPSCIKSKFRNCQLFTELNREVIFSFCWNLHWNQRRLYVQQLVDTTEPKQRLHPESPTHSRNIERKYYLKIDNVKHQVCAQMFCSTLGISQRTIRDWTSLKYISKVIKSPIKYNPAISKAPQKLFLNDFLVALPKLESHYCRRNSKMMYLELPYSSIRKVYRKYWAKCRKHRVMQLSWPTFLEEFHAHKLALFRPRKDRCDRCEAKDAGNCPDLAKHEIHLKRNTEAKKSLEEDVANSPESTAVLTCDVQAVLLAPMLKASALYYKTKLCVHNFTFYDCKSHYVTNYVWSESEGGLVASCFASMMTDKFKEIIDKNKEIKCIKSYSDGCCYQNRSCVLANALLDFSVKNNIIVEQYYLERGHTQMPVDSVHSSIETQLKDQRIYVPFDYVEKIVLAREIDPYEVKMLSYDFFKDFTDVTYYNKIKPGVNCVVDIRCLQYNPDGKIMYKLLYSDDWIPMPHLNKKPKCNVTPLYKSRLPIKKSKYKHLQELKAVIKKKHWSYYDNLPYV